MADHTLSTQRESPPVGAWRPATIWRRLTEPHPVIAEPGQRSRARLLLAVLLGLIVVTVTYELWYVAGIQPLAQSRSDPRFLFVLAGLAFLSVVYWLSRTRHYRWAAAFFVVATNLLMLAVIIVAPDSALDTAWLLLGLLLCSLFFSPRTTALLLAATSVSVLILSRLAFTPSWFDIFDAEIFLVTIGLLIVTVTALRERDQRRLETQARAVAKGEAALRAAIETAREANEELVSRVKELEQRTSEITLLSHMAEMLQTCLTVEEAHAVISQFAHLLFPATSGAVYLLNASRNYIEAAATWGEASAILEERVFAPDECWALRRGRTYLVQDISAELPCHHVEATRRSSFPYLCVPMMAQGEALGVLHLAANEAKANLTGARQRLAQAVAEQLSLALANLKLREALRHQSIRDLLTGLFNRRYLEETLEREILRAARNKSPLGIIMCDIDHFKRFNDTFGHEAGDMLLHELGNYLLSRTRGADIACRYGGEEFALILPEASLEASQRRAEELRVGISNLRVEYRGQPLGTITLSLGVAAFPDHGLNRDALLRTADAALYRAKQEGRDRVAVGTTTEE